MRVKVQRAGIDIQSRDALAPFLTVFTIAAAVVSIVTVVTVDNARGATKLSSMKMCHWCRAMNSGSINVQIT